MKNWYYTFGTADHFPYQINDYVIVVAENQCAANILFRQKHPDAHEGLINCACFYSEEEWNSGVKDCYKGVAPKEIIR